MARERHGDAPDRDHPRHAHAADTRDVRQRRRLTIVFGLALAYSLIELFGGLWTSSLALLADAFHLISDVGALGLSLFAFYMSRRPASLQRTFGHSRAEILAALANGAALAVVAGVISWNALQRFGAPADVHGPGVMLFATGALGYELFSLWLLSDDKGHNLNVRGAWLHVAGDALGSLGAIASGFLIWRFGLTWADPVASLLISGLILFGAWNLMRDAVDILMEAAPAHVDVAGIRGDLLALDGAGTVHDLHVWTIGSGEVCLSAHVVGEHEADRDKLLHRVREVLRERHAITHTTIQIEPAGASDEDPTCHGACAPMAD